MSTLSTEQIWGLHLQGKSKEAFAAALVALKSVNTKNFTDKDQAKEHFERARQVQVLGSSAAKKSLSWSEARDYLLGSLTALRENYPLAVDESEAAKRAEYWQGISSEDSIQIVYLRDLLHLVQVLSKILPSEEMTIFVTGVNNLLSKLSAEKVKDRFGLIYLTEQAPYAPAKQAYKDFLQKFGQEDGKNYQPNQVVTVSARFMRRSVAEKDFEQMKACLEVMLKIRDKEEKLRKFVLSELVKNLLPFKDELSNAKYRLWRVGAEKDDEVISEVNSLLRSVFVGLEQSQVERILSQTS